MLSAKKAQQIYWESKRRELWNAKEKNFSVLWNVVADNLQLLQEDYT